MWWRLVIFLAVAVPGHSSFVDVRGRVLGVTDICSPMRAIPSLFEHGKQAFDESPEFILEDSRCSLEDRRLILASGVLASLSLCLPNTADALLSLHESGIEVDQFNVFSNLPPIPSNCVRLFLCRHGQTEYNRLKLVQGARVDAPINENGKIQAERLGKALALAAPPPEFIFHSSLSRTKQTAALASQQFISSTPKLEVIPELAEIDFGGVEGVSVDEVRTSMVATYSAWAFGKIDTRMARDGESFREILIRMQKALSRQLKVVNPGVLRRLPTPHIFESC